MKPTTRKRRAIAGHTLVELVLSLTLLGIVMASVGSAMMFAAQASPKLDGPTATLIKDSGALNRIAEDLSQAKYVLERSATSVTILVDDRTGDGVPDHITYAWSGTLGDPLTYALNGSSPVAIIEHVYTFGFAFELTPVITTIPPAIDIGPERVIAAFENSSGNSVDVKDDQGFGQITTPFLPNDIIGFMPTVAELHVEKKSPYNGVLGIDLRASSWNSPTDTSYAIGSANEADFSRPASWYKVPLDQASIVPKDQRIALLLSAAASNDVVAVVSIGNSFGGLIKSNGGQWDSEGFKSLLYRLYGKEISQANEGFDIKRNHLTAVTITLQSVAEDRSPIRRSTRLLKGPEVLDTFWEADFNANPGPQDLNDDGVIDWIYTAGGNVPDGDLVGGVWNAKRSLVPIPRALIDGVVRIDARLRTANGQQASIHGPYVADNDGMNLPIIAMLQEDGEGGQELLIYNDTVMSEPLVTVHDLDADWVDVHLTVLPEQDTLYLKVNGVVHGSYLLAREADLGQRGVWLTGTGDGAAFADARISVGGSYTELEDGGSLLGDVLEGLGGLFN